MVSQGGHELTISWRWFQPAGLMLVPFCIAWNAFLLGCVGAWSLHPVQIGIAKKVFSPPVDEVKWAMRVIEAMGDGTGAVMLDGKMQDDATWKQAKVIVDLARLVSTKDPDLAKVYAL